MNQDDFLKICKEVGALLEGHFELTSGLHSGQYFQCAKLFEDPKIAEIVCQEIGEVVWESINNIDCIVSPALGGIIAGYEVARQTECRNVFIERQKGVMTLRRGFELKKGQRVYIVEDVITTMGTTKEVIEVVEKCGASVMGVGCIVDRSGGATAQLGCFCTVIKIDVVNYHPDDCPLCKEGIPIVKPGSRK